MERSPFRRFLLSLGPLLIGAFAFTVFLRLNPQLMEDFPAEALDIFIWTMIPIFFGLYMLVPLLLQKFGRTRWFEILMKGNFELIVLLMNWIVLAIPLILAIVYMAKAYTSFEILVGILILATETSLMLPGIILMTKKTSFAYPKGVMLFCMVFFYVLGILNWLFLVLGTLNAIAFSMLVWRRPDQPAGSIQARMGKKIVGMLVLGLLVFSPYLYLESGIGGPVELTIPSGNERDVFTIDWTWADNYGNPQGINDSTLDALVYCHNLDRINISLTIALPEEFLNAFGANQIQRVLDRNLPVNIMLLVPKNPDYFYINDMTIDHFYQTYEIYKDWATTYNLTGKFQSIIIDLEPVKKIDRILLSNFNKTHHEHGLQLLQDLVDIMKAEQNPYGTKILGASFGYFMNDFSDGDDSIYRLQAQSLWPADWDGVGFMLFEQGFEGMYPIYTQALAVDYYFGDLGIPYLISKQTYDQLVIEFKMIRNMGFPYTGVWALQDFLANEYKEGNNGTARLIELHETLNVPSDVTFTRTSGASAYIHTGLVFMDYLVWDSIRFSPGRLMGTSVRG
jgi:hypothetical protein